MGKKKVKIIEKSVVIKIRQDITKFKIIEKSIKSEYFDGKILADDFSTESKIRSKRYNKFNLKCFY
jgi:hypothetical protein